MPPRRFGKGHPPKYGPLRDYLAARAEDRITLTFTQVEHIIDASLPPSAYRRDWWTNFPHGRAKPRPGWPLGGGWRRSNPWPGT